MRTLWAPIRGGGPSGLRESIYTPHEQGGLRGGISDSTFSGHRAGLGDAGIRQRLLARQESETGTPRRRLDRNQE